MLNHANKRTGMRNKGKQIAPTGAFLITLALAAGRQGRRRRSSAGRSPSESGHTNSHAAQSTRPRQCPLRRRVDRPSLGRALERDGDRRPAESRGRRPECRKRLSDDAAIGGLQWKRPLVDLLLKAGVESEYACRHRRYSGHDLREKRQCGRCEAVDCGRRRRERERASPNRGVHVGRRRTSSRCSNPDRRENRPSCAHEKRIYRAALCRSRRRCRERPFAVGRRSECNIQSRSRVASKCLRKVNQPQAGAGDGRRRSGVTRRVSRLRRVLRGRHSVAGGDCQRSGSTCAPSFGAGCRSQRRRRRSDSAALGSEDLGKRNRESLYRFEDPMAGIPDRQAKLQLMKSFSPWSKSERAYDPPQPAFAGGYSDVSALRLFCWRARWTMWR